MIAKYNNPMTELNVLLVGDVCADIGVRTLQRLLLQVINEENIFFTVVNGENALDGHGIDEAIASLFFNAGADVITGGNHSLHDFLLRKDFLSIENVLRPANIPEVGGSGIALIRKGEYNFCVANFLGRENMSVADSPFTTADTMLRKFAESPTEPFIIVDFHAESPEEKEAFAFYLDGWASIVAGTHTHVQTADEKILPNGTGYITDIGFTGLAQSVIGSNPAFVLERQQKYFTHEQRWKNSGDAIFSAIVATLDTKTKKTKRIKRILKTITL